MNSLLCIWTIALILGECSLAYVVDLEQGNRSVTTVHLTAEAVRAIESRRYEEHTQGSYTIVTFRFDIQPSHDIAEWTKIRNEISETTDIACGNGEVLCKRVEYHNCVVVPPVQINSSVAAKQTFWVLKILKRSTYDEWMADHVIRKNGYSSNDDFFSSCVLRVFGQSSPNLLPVATYDFHYSSPNLLMSEDLGLISDLLGKHILHDYQIPISMSNISKNQTMFQNVSSSKKGIQKDKVVHSLVKNALDAANPDTITKLVSFYRAFVNSNKNYSKYLEGDWSNYYSREGSESGQLKRRKLLNQVRPVAPSNLQAELGFPSDSDDDDDDEIQGRKEDIMNRRQKKIHGPVKLSDEDSHVLAMLQLEHRIRLAHKNGMQLSMKTTKEELQNPIANALFEGIPHILEKLLKYPVSRADTENMKSEFLPAVTDPVMDSLDSYWRQFAKDLPGLNMREPEGGLDMEHTGISEDLSLAISDEVVMELVGRITEIVLPVLVEGIPNIVTRELIRETVPPVTYAVTEALSTGITDVVQEPVNRLASEDVVKGVIPALTIALAPIITHSLTRKPTCDYYCFYCHHQAIYCSYCKRCDTNSIHTDYYAGYYASYYARYYTYYYGQMDPNAISGPSPA